MQGQSTVTNKPGAGKIASALVLCSSGMDSIYNLLEAKKAFPRVDVLFFDYRQKACPQEYIHVKRISKLLGLKFIKADLPFYASLGSSLNSRAIDIKNFNSIQDVDDGAIPSEWVPNRNAVLVNAAGAFAESMGRDFIVIGVNKEEAARYPDNSQIFLDRANALFEYSTIKRPKLISYTADMSKSQIFGLLMKASELMGIKNIKEYIWSCYDSYEKMCGACESCLRLKRVISEHGQGSEWKDRFLK